MCSGSGCYCFTGEKNKKLTFGGALVVSTPHQVSTILNQKIKRCLTDSWILKYDAILLERDGLVLTIDTCLNLWKGEKDPRALDHDCSHIIEYQTKIRLDLRETHSAKGLGCLWADHPG